MEIIGAVLRERDSAFALEELNLRAPGAGEVLIRVEATGMCHTDLLPRQEGFFASVPLVLGHEGAGVVVDIGDGVDGLDVGDHVIASYASCGACANCSAGQPFNCHRFFAVNMSGCDAAGRPGPMTDADGEPVKSSWFGQSSFATHTVVAASNVVRVDPELPLELLAPLGCGFQTGAGAVFNVLNLDPGASIAVVGVGAVGSAAVMAARATQASVIVAVDRQASRLAAAEEIGATAVIDSTHSDLVTELRGLVRGGVDAVIDTTGSPEVAAAAIDSIRPGGTVVLLGSSSKPITIAPGALAMGKSIVGVLEGAAVPRDFLPRLIDLWKQGLFPVERLVTVYPFADISRAEQDLRTGVTVKPVLVPDAPAALDNHAS